MYNVNELEYYSVHNKEPLKSFKNREVIFAILKNGLFLQFWEWELRKTKRNQSENSNPKEGDPVTGKGSDNKRFFKGQITGCRVIAVKSYYNKKYQ